MQPQRARVGGIGHAEYSLAVAPCTARGSNKGDAQDSPAKEPPEGGKAEGQLSLRVELCVELAFERSEASP